MQNYYKSCKLLLSRLLYVTIFYSISRLLFLFFQWNSFNNITASNFIGGIRFDLSAIFYTNLIIIIALILPGNFKYKSGYQLGVKLLFFIINSIFLATNFIDFVYYEFTGKRSNYDLITASGMEQEIGGLLPSFLKQYWYVFILFIAFIYAFWGFIPSNEFDVKAKTVNIKNSVAQAFIFLACIALSVVIGRGGFVGQYAQGNEPDQHAAYLFNYIGQPWKSQAIIRWISTRLYTNSTVGLTRNDDCGQLSAWYIFSVLGFYPVNPCGGNYVIGSPWVKNATINLPNGKQFKIKTENQAMDNKFIEKF